ncbi:hypothetical protein V7S43_016442 [Phytophthora oleae]|uniref:Uncharacterized protein n=1 Tax=Phytophthora oleae TaxID=2107226 RepID=A0ABD3EVK6_9STRA
MSQWPDQQLPNQSLNGRKSSQSPRAQAFDNMLVGIFSLDEAIPVLNEYLASIQIDDENPGFLLNWNIDNLKAFVATANAQPPVNAPVWMQTPPPHMTVDTLADEIVRVLRLEAGGHCGRVLLAPNSQSQALRISTSLGHLQLNNFMQDVALSAFDNVELHLATSLTSQRPKRSNPYRTICRGHPLGFGCSIDFEKTFLRK